jgi:AcrR family transcriptional regulator
VRADAQRNYDRILAAAEVAFTHHGADASLEEIARQAEVGSATLHRHFPSRQALLNAVFHDRTEVLCAKAHELTAKTGPEEALAAWLQEVATHVTTARGLAESLLQGARDAGPAVNDSSCYRMIADAGDDLLRRAREVNAVRPDVSIADLVTLVNGISLATEQAADAPAEAARLLTLALTGIRPA